MKERTPVVLVIVFCLVFLFFLLPGDRGSSLPTQGETLKQRKVAGPTGTPPRQKVLVQAPETPSYSVPIPLVEPKMQKDSKSGQYIHPALPEASCSSCHGADRKTVTTNESAPVGDLCYKCHEDPTKKFKYVHGPVGPGSCMACHFVHKSPNEFLLKLPRFGICYKCHPSWATADKPFLHPPVEMQACTGCHSPHGTNYRYQLKQERGPDLCFLCHKKADILGKKYPHPPVMQGKCLDCHNPHSSQYPVMARLDPRGELCFSCHKEREQQMKTKKYPHTCAQKSCLNCHSPMGSDNARMLVKYFTMNFYNSYDPKEYALCFKCHDEERVTDPNSTITNFRNGSKNLHYVHVRRKEKGRSCKACHELHATDQWRHIRELSPFGKTMEETSYMIPIKHIKTETGGGCIVGCHKPRYYDRNKEIQNE